MAPRTRRAAASSASRTYHSSPAPQQQHFPTRRRNIKTYGRAPSSARALRQQTLTQFDYHNQIQAAEAAEQEMLVLPAEERSGKRRKTMGDTPSSSFHTQTLTQMLSEKGDDNQDNMLQVADSDDESEYSGLGNEKRETSQELGTNKIMGRLPSARLPQTPSGKRTKPDKDEIMSSQPSPFTPVLREQFISPSLHRSPLAEVSTSINAPMPTEEEMANKSPLSRFRGSQRSLRSSQVAHSTSKSASHISKRAPLAEIQVASLEMGDLPMLQVEATPTRSAANQNRRFIEIPDTDDELESVGPSPQKSSAANSSPQKEDAATELEEDDFGTPSPETRICHGSSPPLAAQLLDEIDADVETDGDDEEDVAEPGTPTPKARRVQIQVPRPSPGAVLRKTPAGRASQKSPPALPKQTQGRSQYQSQGLESQRIPLERIQAMGPQTDRSDVLVSIHPKLVDLIVKGLKNHEFRSVKIPDQVSRIWIYITKPIMELQYMACIGPAKSRGEIEDETADGNAAFNQGKMKAKFAHELLQVYQLNNPVSLQTLKENGWAENAPSSHTYLPPAAVGQLLGNLRCALFEEHGEGATVSQELEEQLLSDLVHSTQMAASDAARKNSDEEETIASTQSPAAAEELRRPLSQASDILFARPPLPAPSQVQRTPVAARSVDFVRPSQATTASQESISPESVPPVSPEKTVPRPTHFSSIPSLPDFDDNETPIKAPTGEFSLASSSDVLLPDSLVAENVRHPPTFIWDSEEENESV